MKVGWDESDWLIEFGLSQDTFEQKSRRWIVTYRQKVQLRSYIDYDQLFINNITDRTIEILFCVYDKMEKSVSGNAGSMVA